MLDNLMKGAGKQALNMFLKAVGGPQNLLNSFNELIVKSEPQMLQGIESKTEQYKDQIQEDEFLQYVFKPLKYRHPETGEDMSALVVYLMKCKRTEAGQVVELDNIEKTTIENFFNTLLNAYIENGEK